MATRTTRTKRAPHPRTASATRPHRRVRAAGSHHAAGYGRMIAIGSLIGVGVLAALGVSALLLITEVPELKRYRRYIPRDLQRRIPQWAHEGMEAIEPVGERLAEAGGHLRDQVRSALRR